MSNKRPVFSSQITNISFIWFERPLRAIYSKKHIKEIAKLTTILFAIAMVILPHIARVNPVKKLFGCRTEIRTKPKDLFRSATSIDPWLHSAQHAFFPCQSTQ